MGDPSNGPICCRDLDEAIGGAEENSMMCRAWGQVQFDGIVVTVCFLLIQCQDVT